MYCLIVLPFSFFQNLLNAENVISCSITLKPTLMIFNNFIYIYGLNL
jgi:hypothetical protein